MKVVISSTDKLESHTTLTSPASATNKPGTVLTEYFARNDSIPDASEKSSELRKNASTLLETTTSLNFGINFLQNGHEDLPINNTNFSFDSIFSYAVFESITLKFSKCCSNDFSIF